MKTLILAASLVTAGVANASSYDVEVSTRSSTYVVGAEFYASIDINQLDGPDGVVQARGPVPVGFEAFDASTLAPSAACKIYPPNRVTNGEWICYVPLMTRRGTTLTIGFRAAEPGAVGSITASVVTTASSAPATVASSAPISILAECPASVAMSAPVGRTR